MIHKPASSVFVVHQAGMIHILREVQKPRSGKQFFCISFCTDILDFLSTVSKAICLFSFFNNNSSNLKLIFRFVKLESINSIY